MIGGRRVFLLGLGRSIAAGALAIISARLVFCRRKNPGLAGAGGCPRCPLSEICLARAETSPQQDPKEGGSTRG